MGKYEPLTRYLERSARDSVDVDFSQIEDILGFALPKSAYRHQAWWANQSDGSHSHARGWQDAGWETRLVNLARQTVRFERKSRLQENRAAFRHAPPSGLEDLIRNAMQLSGIEDRDELLRKAVSEFIQREAGRQLIALGGTMPDAQAAPRRRFVW